MGSGSAPVVDGHGPRMRRGRLPHRNAGKDLTLDDPTAAGLLKEEASSLQDSGGADKSEATEDLNAVSRLQEFIQGCSSFSPHTKVLTWTFEHQVEEDTSLRFRATVSFIYGSVPHHFAGDWQTSKKKAQRDTAERVRHYLAHREDSGVEQLVSAPAAIDPNTVPDSVLEELEHLSAEVDSDLQGGRDTTNIAEWRTEEREVDVDMDEGSGHLRAALIVYVDGVPHAFSGAWRSSVQAARRDTLDRVLWYFGKSDSEYGTETRVSIGDTATAATVLPKGQAAGVPERDLDTEEKTLLMSVQNALQKLFAKDTPPGQRVWIWHYDEDAVDAQLFRARVEVPAWGQHFYGDWCRGKKKAQRSACLAVKSCLVDYLGAFP